MALRNEAVSFAELKNPQVTFTGLQNSETALILPARRVT
jgi:hypothetical protein